MTNSTKVDVEKIGLSDFVILILERRWVFLICTVSCLAAGFALTNLLSGRFVASAVIEKPSGKQVNLSLPAATNSRVSGIINSVTMLGGNGAERCLGFLSSRRLAEKAIYRFSLVHHYGFDRRRGYCIEDVMKRYFRNVDGVEDGLGNIVVSVSDKDPVIAAAMANFLATEMDSIALRLSRERARDSRIFFEERLASIKRDLATATNLLARFQAENNYIDLDWQTKNAITSLADLEGEKMAVGIQIAWLKNQFGPGNLRGSEQEERELVLQRKIGDYVNRGGGDLMVALHTLPERAVMFGQLLRNARVQESLYEFVLKFREQAKFAEADNVPRLTMLDYAQVPEKKTQPQPALIPLMFFFGGCILASFWILLARWREVQRRHGTLSYAKIRRLRSLCAGPNLVPPPDNAGEVL